MPIGNVDTARYLQIDDPRATRSAPGRWVLNSAKEMREHSNIGPAERQLTCGTKVIFFFFFLRAILKLFICRLFFVVYGASICGVCGCAL